MSMLRMLNLALRFFVELAMLAAIGVWGFHMGANTALGIVLAVGVPLAAALVWGVFISPKAQVAVARWLWVVLQVILFELAALGLAWSGYTTLALVFAAVVLANSMMLAVPRRG